VIVVVEHVEDGRDAIDKLRRLQIPGDKNDVAIHGSGIILELGIPRKSSKKSPAAKGAAELLLRTAKVVRRA
jgi:hypothetical protein